MSSADPARPGIRPGAAAAPGVPEPPGAIIAGCAGTVLTAAEAAFFRQARPAGFILFQRNCANPSQLRRLTAALVASVEPRQPLILIDQEGGRVARLRPPHWRVAPPAGFFGAMARTNRQKACEAARLSAELTARALHAAGINVNCVPCLDLRESATTTAIGDRAFSDDPALVTALGEAVVAGSLAGGVLPVIKHMPGHGRARVDSHQALPRVTATATALGARDCQPFRAMAQAALGMTAHLLYEAWDPDAPASLSHRVIDHIIRTDIGFHGLLLTDDISMAALPGSLAERATAAVRAGCDIVLHCSGYLDEMRATADAAGPLSPAGQTRLARAIDRLPPPPAGDGAQAARALQALLA